MSSSKINICHINLARGFRGGERQTFLLIKALSRHCTQLIVVRKKSPLVAMLSNVKGVFILEIKKPFVLKLHKLQNVSLIHAHEAKAAHLAYLMNIVYKTPYIVTRRVDKTPKNKFFASRILLSAKKVVAISSQIKRNLRLYDDRICADIIHSCFSSLPFNDTFVHSLKEKYHNRFVIGHVGALVNKDKGQIHIINVARKIYKEYPDIHFLFLGQGVDEKYFKQEAAGLNNVEFAGFQKNIGDYYKVFDLFLYPSLNEGLGSAVLDAFYFQLPVIATNTGGIPDMVEDLVTGLLVEPGDEDAMYEKIVELYNNRAFGEKLALRGKACLDKFSIEHAKDKYLDLYKIASGMEKQE